MARKLMVVGTASHVGKSSIVAALCRILHQDGVRVAPFKSQNMSLNSYVCRDGAEIGRAQVVQAEAAGIEPVSDMNPILLKPSGARGIQVVLHGRVYGTLSAGEYYEKKSFFLEESLKSFQRLASRFDVVVLEGAGSAAEVNLKDRDIVNLPFAKAVGAPALLVGDIDRGGVFASIIGTLDLLDPGERELVRGFIINRFRGDVGLFASGREFLEVRTGLPCFGILPYIESLRLDEEDSVALDDHRPGAGQFRIGVIKLPHISNHTDFDRLGLIPGVTVDYIEQPNAAFDLVIIPGTKNTMSDLKWLIGRGFREFLLETVERHGWVLGICGGYQMLGRTISDPFGVESGGTMDGLNLLPVETEMAKDKVTVQSRGRSFLGPNVEGYEIHMGRTTYLGNIEPFITKDDGATDGAMIGRIAGTYFHGLFDNPEFTEQLLSVVTRDRKLIWRPERTDFNKDDEYDRLAAVACKCLDIKRVYEVLEL
jgi:adenosylcobyric acid synthase